MSAADQQKVTIVDFGGQYAHLISRRIKDLGVYNEVIASSRLSPEKFIDTRAIILSGGPRSIGTLKGETIPNFLEEKISDPDIPILGICYGHQLLGHLTGAVLSFSQNREYGRHLLTLSKTSPLLEKSAETENMDVWMSHGDQIEEVGPGFEIFGSTEGCPVAMMGDTTNRIYGLQYHPEVTHTVHGREILRNFLFNIAELSKGSFALRRYTDYLTNELSEVINSDQVIMGVSGGVDSTVAAHLLHNAIGDQLHTVFVDHGLLRNEEVNQVIHLFTNIMKFKNFHVVDAQDRFLHKLRGVTDPEKKREIIGHTFIEVFEQTARDLQDKYGRIKYLGQGTIYSDRIESGAVGSSSEKIKSHHNLTLPENMELELIEPLKDLYKDEVRVIGGILGISGSILERYPFPGPGLAVRILGEVTKQRIQLLQRADYIFTSMIYDEGLNELAWQAFAALLPVKATGVQGDNRAYGYIIALRSVQSHEGMTADFSRFSWEFLGKVSTNIINTIPDVTRVVYDISTKPPATIEFE